MQRILTNSDVARAIVTNLNFFIFYETIICLIPKYALQFQLFWIGYA